MSRDRDRDLRCVGASVAAFLIVVCVLLIWGSDLGTAGIAALSVVAFVLAAVALVWGLGLVRKAEQREARVVEEPV